MGDLPLLGTNAQIIRIVEALFGVQPGNTYYTNFQDYVADTSLDSLSNALVGALAPADSAALAATVAANYQVDPALETDTGENVIALLETYITAQLNTVANDQWGAKILEITNQYTNLWADPLLGESVIAFNDAVVASLVYSANPANPDVNNPDGGPVVGDAVNLTVNQDTLTGTAANDMFNAFIFDNQNTLQSGDSIDGGAGMDTLFADIGNSQNFAITPQTSSVEKLQVRAQAVSFDSNENNMSNGVQIDAERMVGTNWYESNNSRADVTIEDVRILRTDAYGDDVNQITSDVTIAMVSTDPGNIDLGVYFDQHSLVNEGDSQSNSVTFTIGNQIEEPDFDAAAPLKDVPYNNVGFLVGGEQVILALDLAGVETYEQLWTVFQAAFDDAKAAGDYSALLTNVTLTRSIGTDTFFSRDGVLRNADEFLMVIDQGDITPSDIGWSATGGLPSNNAFSARVVQGDVTVTSNLITSEIILDDVGRGSMGGDLIVGGMSIGTGDVQGEGTSNSKGVEQFNIKVERSSQLQEIQSTNNTLQEVYIVNGDTNGDLVVAGDTGLGLAVDQGDLPGSDVNGAGFRDVRVLDASAMVGKVDLNAELTSAVVGKYLDLKDDATNAAADNVGFMYDLGTNDDALFLGISSANLSAAGTTTREDFYLNIDGNAGNDTITTLIGDGSGTDTTNWYVNSKINANLTVNGDAGDDTIATMGAGDFFINGGSGNDTVYANNDGILGAGRIAEVQTLVFGDAGDLDTQGQVTVSFSNGESFTTAGIHAIATDNDGATVATEVGHQITADGGITGASFVVVDNTIVVTYGALYAGPENVVNATISDIATDITVTVAETTPGTTTLVEAVKETVVITTTIAGAAGDTLTFNDGSAVLTLVDTDSNGSVTAFEISEQLAAHTYTDYVVVASNPSIGTVTLETKVVGAVGAALTVVDSGASNATPAVAIAGVDAVAETGANEVQTITVTNGADRSGSITVGIDLDQSTVIDADELFEIAITAGNEAAGVSANIVAGINAIAGVSAVQGAASPNLNDVIVTFDDFGDFIPVTILDGALVSSSVSETVQGVEGSLGGAATWAVNAADVDFVDLESNLAVPNGILYNSTLTVTYSGARLASSGVINDAAVANSNGFESTVTIGTTNSLGSQLQVNQAIKDAINNDAVLNKLLMATDGPSNTLVITSLVDGRFEANDLAIDIAAPASLSATEVTSVNAAYEALIGDSTADLNEAGLIAVIETQIAAIDAGGAYTNTVFAQTGGVDMAGSTSTSDSDNTIDLGTGLDVAVLGTDDTSNDTLVMEGTFGDNSIFNFDNTTGAAQDMLDFTAYLMNEVSASGSTASTTYVAVTGENTGVGASTLTANEVATVNDFSSATGETWANLTASDLLAAITGGDTYGNITDSSFDVSTVTDLVGDVQNGIIMVENDLNDGEYKVFSTFADDSSQEFTAVTLVGTLDFGDSIDASVAGLLTQQMA